MPAVFTQPSQYLNDLDKLRRQAKEYNEQADKKLEAAQYLLKERSEYFKKSTDVQIGFCINPKKEKVYRAFVSWYDHALDCRLVFDKANNQVVAVPYIPWISKYELVQIYRTDLDLSSGLSVLSQALQIARKPAEAILCMLSVIGYINIDLSTVKTSIATELLYNKIVVSDNFHEVIAGNEEKKD